MAAEEYLAFWSYARLDDGDDEKLSGLRERLERELRELSGHPHQIFQDKKDIRLGKHWSGEVHDGLRNADFLMPIVTPLFFKSDACRAEVAAFARREQEAHTTDLILPIYWIDTPLLNNTARLGADRTARLIHQHQWDDWRPLRAEPLDGDKAQSAITALAGKLLERYQESAERTLKAAAISGAISWPSEGQRVLRRSSIAGTLAALPRHTHAWIVVTGREKIHPQCRLQPDSTGFWNGRIHLGSPTPNASDGHHFTVELAMVTDATNEVFETYLKEAHRAGEWPGIPPQSEYRVVSRRVLIRDDRIAALPLEGTYNEYTAGPTGATITIRPTDEARAFRTEATRPTGKKGWVGSLHVDAEVADWGTGRYGADDRYEDGIHEFRLDRAGGVIEVFGRSTKGQHAFHTIWKKK
jgi:hypothetical protein